MYCNEVLDLKMWYVQNPSESCEASHGACKACEDKVMAELGL